MRAVLVTYGSRGDVEPVVGLAVGLRGIGAEVAVCAPPDEEFGRLLAGAGVAHVPFGRSVRALVTGAGAPPVGGPFGMAAELVDAHFDVVAGAVEGADAVVASGLMPAGVRSVAEALGVPYSYACLHPFELPSPHWLPAARPGPPAPPGLTDHRALWDLDADRVNGLYRAALNTRRAAIGLAPVDDVRAHVFTERPMLAADPTLGPWRDSTDLDVVQTGAWILPDSRPLPADLVAFLDAGAPPVFVGYGSMALRGSADAARVAVEAVRAQGRRVLLSRGWAELGPIDGADDCLAVGEVNQQALFGRVAAVVHHGGAGTTTTAARAGAPQVVVPQVVDQPHWAARVAGLGIGAAHDGPTPTVGSLSAALATALAPETRARAGEVAAAIRTDGVTTAAALLLDALTHRGAPLPA